jgi:hypothetical protein
MIIYDSNLEKEQLKLINEQFPKYEIVNPNGYFTFSGMYACYCMIQDCTLLVFTTLNGYVGKGVYSEIIFAKRIGIKILYLKDKKFHEKFAINIFDPQDWKFKYAKVKIVHK